MKELVCKMCNSKEIVKTDDLYICESCGTKYTADEAEKMSVEVVLKNDNSEKISALLRAAKRARDIGNWDSAIKYYDEILALDADNYEATFYSSYCVARNCKIIQMENAGHLVANTLKPTFSLIKTNVSETLQPKVVADIAFDACELANMLYTGSVNHFHSIDASIQTQYTSEMYNRCKAAIRILSECGTLLDEMFGEKCSSTTEEVLQCAVILYGKCSTFADKDAFNKVLETLRKYNPEYVEDFLAKEKEKEIKKAKSGVITFLIPTLVCIGFLILSYTVFPEDSILTNKAIRITAIAGVCLYGLLFLASRSWLKQAKKK